MCHNCPTLLDKDRAFLFDCLYVYNLNSTAEDDKAVHQQNEFSSHKTKQKRGTNTKIFFTKQKR